VEWVAWIWLALATTSAAYLAGTLRTTALEGARRFWVLLSIAAGLILVEEAGDVRHGLREQTERWVGSEPAGIEVRILLEIPFMTLLALIPVYAVVRYGGHVWRVPRVRPHLVMAYTAFGLGGGANATRYVGDWYIAVGERIEHLVGEGNVPEPGAMGSEWIYFQLVDGPIEETFEYLGALFLLTMSVAFARSMAPGAGVDAAPHLAGIPPPSRRPTQRSPRR
jgi:hypothetical protein